MSETRKTSSRSLCLERRELTCSAARVVTEVGARCHGGFTVEVLLSSGLKEDLGVGAAGGAARMRCEKSQEQNALGDRVARSECGNTG